MTLVGPFYCSLVFERISFENASIRIEKRLDIVMGIKTKVRETLYLPERFVTNSYSWVSLQTY